MLPSLKPAVVEGEVIEATGADGECRTTIKNATVAVAYASKSRRDNGLGMVDKRFGKPPSPVRIRAAPC